MKLNKQKKITKNNTKLNEQLGSFYFRCSSPLMKQESRTFVLKIKIALRNNLGPPALPTSSLPTVHAICLHLTKLFYGKKEAFDSSRSFDKLMASVANVCLTKDVLCNDHRAWLRSLRNKPQVLHATHTCISGPVGNTYVGSKEKNEQSCIANAYLVGIRDEPNAPLPKLISCSKSFSASRRHHVLELRVQLPILKGRVRTKQQLHYGFHEV